MSDPVLIQSPNISTSSVATSVESFHTQLLDSLYDGVYFVDAERRITYWNKGAELLTGYEASEVVGRHCFDNFLVHVDQTGHALCSQGCPLSQTISDGKRREAEVYLRHKLGHRVPVSVRASPIEIGNGSRIGAVEVFSDISALKRLERQAGELNDLACHDGLTGVANRRYIELKVQQAIEEIKQFKRDFGLVLIDVDQFKAVNDTYGHLTGDASLKAICKTLSHCIRPGDIVGRWGGDEILLVAKDVTAASLEHLAERCRRLIQETSVPIGTERLQMSASLGATLLREDDTWDIAVNRADRLMYASKSAGRNRMHLG
jgi:diguanylate cyclase (GGDEF)-like protein/PAS domain S-box-containing protein